MSALLLDDALKLATPLTNDTISKTLTFHKVLLRHTWGVVASLVIVLLQSFSWFWQWNNFENRLIFGIVKAYKSGVPIFGPPCTLLQLMDYFRALLQMICLSAYTVWSSTHCSISSVIIHKMYIEFRATWRGWRPVICVVSRSAWQLCTLFYSVSDCKFLRREAIKAQRVLYALSVLLSATHTADLSGVLEGEHEGRVLHRSQTGERSYNTNVFRLWEQNSKTGPTCLIDRPTITRLPYRLL